MARKFRYNLAIFLGIFFGVPKILMIQDSDR